MRMVYYGKYGAEIEARNDVFVVDRIGRFVEFYADRVEYN